MRNSQQPPRYGAEGPPGGVEAWNAQRNAQQAQQQGGKKNLMQRVGGAVANMNPQWAQNRQAQQQAMSQPRPWGEVGRMQWGQAQGASPQMPPQAQGAPQPGMGVMPMQPQGAPQQPQMPQQQGQVPQRQQTGMAGLGQAMARVNALRNPGAKASGSGMRGGRGLRQEY